MLYPLLATVSVCSQQKISLVATCSHAIAMLSAISRFVASSQKNSLYTPIPMLSSGQIRSRIQFYIWCNMHWPEGPQVRFPISITLLRFRLQMDVWHPKKWFEDLPYEYLGDAAQDCYLGQDSPPKDADELLDLKLSRLWDSF